MNFVFRMDGKQFYIWCISKLLRCKSTAFFDTVKGKVDFFWKFSWTAFVLLDSKSREMLQEFGKKFVTLPSI